MSHSKMFIFIFNIQQFDSWPEELFEGFHFVCIISPALLKLLPSYLYKCLGNKLFISEFRSMSFSKIPPEDDSLSKCRSTNSLTSSKISFQSLSKFYASPLKKKNTRKTQCIHSEATTSDLEISDEAIKKKSQQFITAWRRAIIEDKPAIKKLCTLTGNIASALFRKKKIDELIEQSYFTIVQMNSEGEVVSFTAYNQYPNIPSVSLFWTEWLKTHYRIKDISERNVLFIHYMVWEPQRESEFLPLLLETSFTEFIHLKHIIIVKPPKTQIPNFYAQYFIPVLPFGLEEYKYDSVQSLLVCLRTTIIQPFPIRTAFEDELNSVTKILSNVNVNVLKDQQNYTLEVKNDPTISVGEGKKILICEDNGLFIGLMVLNFTIDLNFLNQEYELVSFNGLRKGYLQTQENDELPEAALKRSSSTKNKDHHSFFKSSDFLFNHINWKVSIKETSVNESYSPSRKSSSAFSFDSDFLQFSSYNSESNTDSSESDFNLSESLSHSKIENFSRTDIKVTYHPSLSRTTHFSTPLLDGQSNCFLIDFFTADTEEVDEKLILLDFLKAAFRVVRDKDYGLLTIPSDFFPNSLQEFFVRVPSRLMSSTKLELYLCNKHALPDTLIFVKNAEAEDLAHINNFLKNVDEGEAVYEDISKACFSEENLFKSYILFAEKRIIGVSLIDCRDYQDMFYTYFDIAKHIPEVNVSENKSLLKHLIINPTYLCHVRFFMRQIMKFSNLTCLYYAYGLNKGSSSLETVLREFIPVKPRKNMIFEKSYLIADERNCCSPPFSLYFLTDKSCDFNKIHLNIIIVVVGASRTALSFLEDLIFGSTKTHVHYNNLICVTPQGLETHHDGSIGSEITEQMFPVRDDCSKSYVFKLTLKTYVSFVHGVMTAINRAEKYITINNKVIIKYDYLILTCGVQYLSPVPKAKESSTNLCQKQYIGSLARFLKNSDKQKITRFKHPSNMFLINTDWDAKYSLRILQNLIHKTKKTEKKIIVYGHNLNVYLTIHTLMKLGIPGEVIAFVEPFLLDKVTVFNDYSVDQAVLKSLENGKVNYYTRYFFYDWTINTDDESITSVIFHSKTNKLVIPCLAFFPFVEKLVSEVTYKACSEAGLVYDGRLVIDHNFRTNDQYIYAAGSFTKYARRYFASDQNHEHFSSREVGQRLAQIIRSKVDPFVEDETKKESALVPQMKEPVMYYCQLPGDFNFFVLRKPGKDLDLETAYNLKDYGEVLYTGNCQMTHGLGYFRLHLSPEGFVRSITCYTKDKIDYVNLSYLYGLHEKLLNNLLCRYDLSLIPDFFDYFRQPWAHALFHENFKNLRKFNAEVLRKKLPDGTSFIDKIVENLESNNWQPLPNCKRQLLEKIYEETTIKEEIQNNLREFLDYFSADLPMYATSKAMKAFP